MPSSAHRKVLNTQSVAPWRGIAKAAGVGVAFAANSTLAGAAYAGGSNALSVLVVRAAVAFVALYVLLGIRQVPRSLPALRRYQALGLGMLFASYSYGVLAAIQFMPVALAVVTFYTYPLLVAAYAWWRGKTPFSAGTALAFLVAFAGIVLALDIFGARPNMHGVAMALASAVVVTLVLNLTPYVRGTGDSRPITLHMLGMATSLFAVGLVASGDFLLPQTALGWIGFLGAPVFYTFGIIAIFEVLGEIGPLRMSLVMNIEPVAAVIFGFVLLDQRLGSGQLVGVALVVVAVVLIEGATVLHLKEARSRTSAPK